MTVVTDAYLAATPTHYWPLNETSGTVAADLCGSPLNGTCVGMTMGGANAPSFIGGKCPTFTGTEHILLNANKILGGLSAWSVGAWVRYAPPTPDASTRAFYGEANPTTGNDLIAAAVIDPTNTSASAKLIYGDDGNAPVTLSSAVLYITGGWVFMVMTRSGANVEVWWNCGGRLFSAGAVASSTWTNGSVASWLGGTPRGASGWKGDIAHFALWNRVLSQADQRLIYAACTPLSRTPPTRTFFRANAIWNQDLTDPGNVPTLRSDSAATVTKLVAQVATYGDGSNNSTGPFYEAIAGTTHQRVRITGGAANNLSDSHPDLYNLLGSVPIPAGFVVPPYSDVEANIYDDDADRLFEFIQMRKTLCPPIFHPSPLYNAVVSGGTIPAGVYHYAVVGALADGSYGQAGYVFSLTVNGSQRVDLSWLAVEGADHFLVYRTTVGPALPYRLIASLSSSTTSFSDTGVAGTAVPSFDPGTPTAVTSDWGCLTAGVLENTDDNVGHFEQPHVTGWGASGSGLSLWGGTVSIHEAQTYTINHAIGMALPAVTIESHVYPAQRNDGWSPTNHIQEGTRFQLDPSFDVSTIPYLFERAVATAMKKYGAYVRDVSNSVSVYIEDPYGLGGRDIYPDILQGRYDYETFSGFPWSQMRVIDPTWTQLQTASSPTPPALFATLIDDFETGTFDPVKWQVVGTSFILGGQAHVRTDALYSGSVGSTTSRKLTGSSIFFQAVQVPSGDVGDEAALKLTSAVDATCYLEFVYSGGSLIGDYNSSAGVRTRVFEIPYNSLNHAWWRISEASGTVHWEVSPNGQTWTELGSLVWTTSGWTAPTLDTMQGYFYAGNWNGLSNRPDFIVDNVNNVVTIPPVLAVAPSSLSFAASEGGTSPTPKTVLVTNAGAGTLDVAVSDDASWLTVTPSSPAVPSTLTIWPSLAGLTAGTYTATVTITATTPGATGSPKTIIVSFTVNPAPVVPGSEPDSTRLYAMRTVNSDHRTEWVDIEDLDL